MIKKCKSFKKVVIVFLCCAIFSQLVLPIATFARTNYFINEFAQNDITFYDPDECVDDCQIACIGSDGSNVTVIGDSILADTVTQQKLKEKLSGLSLDSSSYDALVSRPWDDGVKVAKSMQLKDIVLFELGTNNDHISATQLNDLLSIVGTSRTLILVTPYIYGNATAQAGYDQTAELFKQTATSNSQIVIADWASVAKNDDLPLDYQSGVSWTGVHPKTSDERTLYVETLTKAINGSCNSGEAVVSGSTAEEKTWSGFISLGFTPAQTAGIMGNIAHEGLMNPAQWQVGKEADWGKSLREIYNKGAGNDTGMGMVAFTWYTYYDILDKYYQEHAPDLLAILEDPWTYSVADNGSHYCDGTSCFLKKVDDNTANRLYSTQITIIADTVRGKYKDSHGFDFSGYFNCTTPATCAEWWLTNYEKPADPAGSRASRIADAEKFYNEFKDKTSFSGTSGTGGTSGSNCSNNSAATAFHKYNFTDGELRGIIAMAKNENGGSLAGIKSEISIMANLAEYHGHSDESGLINYVRNGGWFASSTGAAYNESHSATSEELEAARDILNNGNRTLPAEILEHDCFAAECGAGVTTVSNNGVAFNYKDRSQYKRGVTKLQNNLGATYIFWDWADPENKTGDPFGYFESNPPDLNFSTEATQKATSAVSSLNVTWENGWITSGIDGYVKSTPESIGLTLGDSSSKQSYITNRPIDGKVGPNKILLHNTEGGYTGTNAIEIYQGNAYPPHFTIDPKNKKLYQHFSVDNPSSAIASYDTSAGVQIEIVGFSTGSSSNKWYLYNSAYYGDEEWAYVAKLLVAISDYTGIPLASSVDWNNRTDSSRLSVSDFIKYQGVLGHQHAPGNSHNDPGDVWSLISKHLDSFTTSYTGTCPNSVQTVADFEWYGQCDDQWGNTSYGGCGTTCSSGCGVVSFTMMAQALTKVKLDPAEVTTNAGNKGLHVCGSGSSWSLPSVLAEDYGLAVEVLGSPSIDQLNSRLSAGEMIWTCGKGSNPFTSGGHCIGIRGITASGKWLLADSNGGNKGSGSKGEINSLETEWDPSQVYPRMNTFSILKRK